MTSSSLILLNNPALLAIAVGIVAVVIAALGRTASMAVIVARAISNSTAVVFNFSYYRNFLILFPGLDNPPHLILNIAAYLILPK